METSTQGTSLLTVLLVVFIVLKLLGVITWSWWWVTLPLWGPAIVALVVLLLVYLWMR